MSKHRHILSYEHEDAYRCPIAPYALDGSEGHRIIDALVVAMIGAGDDFVEITRATKMAKLQLQSLLSQVVPTEAVMNAIETVERER
jgi:hypothetical protein